MMSKIPKTMSLTRCLQAWMDREGWEDEIAINEENLTSQLAVGYRVKEHPYQLYIDIDEKPAVFGVYLYSPVIVPESRFSEVSMLLNLINMRTTIGRFACVSGGKIQFCVAYDVKGSELEPQTIDNMLGRAGDSMDAWRSEIGLVVFSNMTASDALEIVDIQENSGQSGRGADSATSEDNSSRSLDGAVTQLLANGGSKAAAAQLIYESRKESPRSDVIAAFISLAKLTPAGASTYYHNIKSKQ